MDNWIRRAASAIAWRWRCQWAVLMAGRSSKEVLETSPLRKLLIVCHGNIYRSPYAAELLRERLAQASQVRSSGFHPVADRPSPRQHVEMSLESNVDLTGHRSSIVSAADLAWADAIVLMDRHNWQLLRKQGADSCHMIWLGTLDGGAEIADPYGAPHDEARKIMRRVHQCTEALAAAVLARRGSSAT
jgi:protein-tyrosine-phosphatase